MKANTIRSSLMLSLAFALPVSAAGQQLAKYGVNALPIVFHNSPGGSKGTQKCVDNLEKIFAAAGITVNTAQLNKEGQESFGIVIGNYQRKLIVSGNCLSGGKESLVSVVNPYNDKSSMMLINKIKATLH